MRRFLLRRVQDVNGVSGTGIVAEGVMFSSGWVALTWLTHLNSMAFYHSIDTLTTIHGHEGRTQVEFVDELDQGKKPKVRRARGATN